ncbi:MBL fold metallo-hydrolase [bacterium]|nr:MBL fold metallo-hydrolase [bacterium]MBU1957837.1 MBL fold metallo-hydrolase [bacterium]
MRYFVSFFFFTVYLFGFDYHLKPYTISDGINCFFGLSSQASKDNGGNMINSCYVETEEGYIVIDSGPTYRYAQDTYEIMEKQKKIPVKYVINTSSDEVHILGNSFFKEQGATLLGPKNYKRHLKENKELELAKKVSEDAIKNTRLIALDSYLEGDSTIVLGGTEIHVKLIENDDEHLVVNIPSKKILFAGDMIFNNRIVPLKDKRSLLVWQNGLKQLSRLPWDDIVSAHGYMTRRSALKNTESYLALLKSEVSSSIQHGESREEAIKRVKLSSFSEDRLYGFWHPKNVASVYDELKSNTNLDSQLPIPPIMITPKEKTVKSKTSNQKVVEKKVVKTKVVKPKPKSEPKKTTKKTVPNINYVSFDTAMKRAKAKNKIVFIKVRSTTCKYCDQLDAVMRNNNEVKSIANKYFEVVKINTDYDSVPLDIRIASTPMIIFIRPNDQKVLMELPGIRALGELLEILNEAVDDGHKGGYLKP